MSITVDAKFYETSIDAQLQVDRVARKKATAEVLLLKRAARMVSINGVIRVIKAKIAVGDLPNAENNRVEKVATNVVVNGFMRFAQKIEAELTHISHKDVLAYDLLVNEEPSRPSHSTTDFSGPYSVIDFYNRVLEGKEPTFTAKFLVENSSVHEILELPPLLSARKPHRPLRDQKVRQLPARQQRAAI